MSACRYWNAVSIAVLALTLALVAPARQAMAGFILGSAANYGLLYEGNSNQTLSFNNSNLDGNIGIGATGKFQGNGPGTINGVINFSAANTGQFSNSGLTFNPLVGQSGIQRCRRDERLSAQ